MSEMTVVYGVLASLIAAGVAAPLVYRALLRMQSRQTVSEHIEEHAHKQGTPTMGGIMVLVGLVVGMLVGWDEKLLAPLILVLGFGIVGFADDYIVPKIVPGKRGLGWMPKLGMEIGACLLGLWVVGISDFVVLGLCAFTILFFSNAYNFSDGLDTLSAGLGILLCVGFGWLGTVSNAPEITVAMAVLGVAFLPFLIYNAPPAKVFMGDVGALPIGAVIGWAAAHILFFPYDYNDEPFIQYMRVVPGFFNDPANWAVLFFSLVMLIELIPVPLQIASVKLRKKRMFNFKTPVHHAFQEKGWPETRIVWLFHVVQVGCLVLGWAAFHFVLKFSWGLL